VTQASPYHNDETESRLPAGTVLEDLRLYLKAVCGPFGSVTEVNPARASSDPKLPRRRQRKPSIDRMIKQAERSGKRVTSITTADGATLRFDEPKPEPTEEATNPWLAAIPARKRR
jgi:hypothetical protein